MTNEGPSRGWKIEFLVVVTLATLGTVVLAHFAATGDKLGILSLVALFVVLLGVCVRLWRSL